MQKIVRSPHRPAHPAGDMPWTLASLPHPFRPIRNGLHALLQVLASTGTGRAHAPAAVHGVTTPAPGFARAPPLAICSGFRTIKGGFDEPLAIACLRISRRCPGGDPGGRPRRRGERRLRGRRTRGRPRAPGGSHPQLVRERAWTDGSPASTRTERAIGSRSSSAGTSSTCVTTPRGPTAPGRKRLRAVRKRSVNGSPASSAT